MSIYPVPINKWFIKGHAFYEHRKDVELMLKHCKCKKCGGPVTMEKGWIYHAAPWGYAWGEAWCSDDCYGDKSENY